MKIKKIVTSIFILSIINLFALNIQNDINTKLLYALDNTEQNIVDNNSKAAVVDKNNEQSNHGSPLIKVMLVILVIWIGLSLYLFRLDRKISKLEKEINEL